MEVAEATTTTEEEVVVVTILQGVMVGRVGKLELLVIVTLLQEV